MNLLKITNKLTEEIETLLRKSIIGTPGKGMLYQHVSLPPRIKRLSFPYFIQLVTKSVLVGTCCFDYRMTLSTGKAYDSFYIRYFSFKDKYRSKGDTRRKNRSGILRNEIQSLFSGDTLRPISGAKHFYYAYVDPGNIRSALLCKEFGFQEVRMFTTFIFSRLMPRINKEITVAKVSTQEAEQVKKLLMDKYSGFNMVSIEDLFLRDAHYVAKDKSGRIVAGAQVMWTHWRIFEMQNKFNTVLLSSLTYIPLLNRLFNKDFKFLAVDCLYYTAGYEQYTEALLSYLLKKQNCYNTLIPADQHSPLFQHLSKLRLGLVSKISKQMSTHVICRFENFSEGEVEEFKQKPAYISAMDIT